MGNASRRNNCVISSNNVHEMAHHTSEQTSIRNIMRILAGWDWLLSILPKASLPKASLPKASLPKASQRHNWTEHMLVSPRIMVAITR